MFSSKGRWTQWLSVWVIVLAVTGCAVITPRQPSAPPEPAPPVAIDTPLPAEQQPDPRELAALQLTDEGKRLLEDGSVDDAISVLERAVSLHPASGMNYYYLAEAWIVKGDILQAKEWNRLADMYLKDDSEWSRRVQAQQRRIKSLSQ
jgi:tetratricopeptide (TPR) repeat protein